MKLIRVIWRIETENHQVETDAIVVGPQVETMPKGWQPYAHQLASTAHDTSSYLTILLDMVPSTASTGSGFYFLMEACYQASQSFEPQQQGHHAAVSQQPASALWELCTAVGHLKQPAYLCGTNF